MGASAAHRELIVGDASKTSVRVTMWDSAVAATQSWVRGDIVAMKGLRITHGDLTSPDSIALSSSVNSVFEARPALPEAASLGAWLARAEGGACEWRSLTGPHSQRFLHRPSDTQDTTLNVHSQHPELKGSALDASHRFGSTANLTPLLLFLSEQTRVGRLSVEDKSAIKDRAIGGTEVPSLSLLR